MQMDAAISEKDDTFTIQSLMFVKALPRKASKVELEADTARSKMEAQSDEVVSIFAAKLRNDGALYKLYLARLQEQDERNKGALRSKKKQTKAFGTAVAKSLMGSCLDFKEVDQVDVEGAMQAHTNFVSDCLQVPGVAQGLGTTNLVIFDAGIFASESLIPKLAQAAALIFKDSERNGMLLLFPWNRNAQVGAEIGCLPRCPNLLATTITHGQ